MFLARAGTRNARFVVEGTNHEGIAPSTRTPLNVWNIFSSLNEYDASAAYLYLIDFSRALTLVLIHDTIPPGFQFLHICLKHQIVWKRLTKEQQPNSRVRLLVFHGLLFSGIALFSLYPRDGVVSTKEHYLFRTSVPRTLERTCAQL